LPQHKQASIRGIIGLPQKAQFPAKKLLIAVSDKSAQFKHPQNSSKLLTAKVVHLGQVSTFQNTFFIVNVTLLSAAYHYLIHLP
jgi:hypothetical protein